MKKILFSLWLIATLVFPSLVHAQAAVTNTSTGQADATNAGVQYAPSSSSHTFVFSPPVTTGVSSGSDCVDHGAVAGGGGWNFISGTVPEHKYNSDCSYFQDVKMLDATCQWNTLQRLTDDRHKRLNKIDVRANWKGGQEAYDVWLSGIPNLSMKECIAARAPKPPAIAAVEQPKPTPPPVAASSPPVGSDRLVTKKTIKVDSTVAFRTGKHDLTAEGMAVITRAMGAFVRGVDNISVVEGHTDSVGGGAYNLALSTRRAEAVAAFIRSLGFEVKDVRGFGLTQPIGDNRTAEGRSMNRRAVIVVSQYSETDVTTKK